MLSARLSGKTQFLRRTAIMGRELECLDHGEHIIPAAIISPSRALETSGSTAQSSAMAQHFQSLSVTEQPSGNDNGGKPASAKTKTAAKAHPGEPPGHFKLKPCNKCNRSFPLENFTDRQSRCRGCDKEERSWQNGCDHAFEKGWLEQQDVTKMKGSEE